MVFVTHNYPRVAGDLPGAFLHVLAVALRGRGHDVAVVTPSDGGRGGTTVLDGVPVTWVRYGGASRERYAHSGRMAETLRDPFGWAALGRMIVGLRRTTRQLAGATPRTVVHAHWWAPAAIAAPKELPTVVTLHGSDARLLERTALARWMARRALGRRRVVTAVSRSVAQEVALRAHVAVDAGHISPMPVRQDARRSEGGRGLVVVSRLTAQKRIDLLIRALREPGMDGGMGLTVVGGGPLRQELEQLAADVGVTDRVTFVGQVASHEVDNYLADADAFVLPAHREGLGLAAVEALVAGVPVVVCSDGGGLVDVVAEGGGVVCDATPGAIASAILGILGPRQRDAAHAAGRGWADRLAPGRVAERVEGWYQEALGG